MAEQAKHTAGPVEAEAVARQHADKWRKRAQKHHRADGRRSDHELHDLERAKICDAIADDIRRNARCAHGVRWPWACDDCDRAAIAKAGSQ